MRGESFRDKQRHAKDKKNPKGPVKSENIRVFLREIVNSESLTNIL